MLRSVRPRLFDDRSGFSLIEVMIVVALIGILTAGGYVIAQDIVPSYRTRMVALEFATHVEQCRSLAISSGRRCRIALLAGEDSGDIDELSANTGKYQIDLEIGDSAGWDTLPVDTVTDSTDDNESSGIVDISSTSANGFRHVSLVNWGSFLGPGDDNDDAIVFDTRGFVDNPEADFTDGFMSVTFANEMAESKGSPDQWTVHIARSGISSLDSSRKTSDDRMTGVGTAGTTRYNAGSDFGTP